MSLTSLAALLALLLGTVSGTIPCKRDGQNGTLDCNGACLLPTNCSLAISGYSTCSQWFTDVTCDDGSTLASDDGTKPNFACPYYACDLNQCNPCGANPDTGTCNTDYTCEKGTCGASGCDCPAGYLGFVCEFGVGVCDVDFLCANGTCTSGGVCACDSGFSGHDCTVALTTTLPHVELQALTDLFHAAGGSAWQLSSGWLTATDPCEGGPKGLRKGFTGVICTEEGHVLELWLGSNKLSGSLPASLTNLPRLSYLNAANNALTGFIDNQLSDLLRHKDMRLMLSGNQIYCPVPTALRPFVGTCVNASLSLSSVSPSTALAFVETAVTISGDLKGGAATLAAYPELRVRMTQPGGTTVDLVPSGAAGADSLTVTLPEVSGAMSVTLSLLHGTERVGGGDVAFEYYGCAAGEYKSLDNDVISCEQCPADTFCVNNRKFDCPAMTSALAGSTSCSYSGCSAADANYSVSACDEGTQKRTVTYQWKAEAAACADSNTSLPDSTTLDCDYVPLKAPATIGLVAVGGFSALVKVLLLSAALIRSEGRPNQPLLCLIVLVGCVLADLVALVLAGMPTDALCVGRPIPGFTQWPDRAASPYPSSQQNRIQGAAADLDTQGSGTGRPIYLALAVLLVQCPGLLHLAHMQRHVHVRKQLSTGAVFLRAAPILLLITIVFAVWLAVGAWGAKTTAREAAGIGSVPHLECAGDGTAGSVLEIVAMLSVLAVVVGSAVVALPLREVVVYGAAFAVPKSLAQSALATAALVTLAGAIHFLMAASASPTLVLVLVCILALLASGAAFALTFLPALYSSFMGKQLLLPSQNPADTSPNKTSKTVLNQNASDDVESMYAMHAEKESLVDSIEFLERKVESLKAKKQASKGKSERAN